MQSLISMAGMAGTARAIEPGRISAGGMEFTWQHRDARVYCSLKGPTKGWIAVGFNEVRSLKNTRFVMAVVSDGLRAEEHIALIPDHKTVQQLGLSPELTGLQGRYEGGMSQVEFSLPHIFEDRPNLRLNSGEKVHLMLAWSHETDFDHHSAWRRHFDVTL